MKKLLSVLLTLVMAVCLVNLNSGQIKADEVNPTPSFKVSFIMQGHGTQISSQQIDQGKKVTKPADPTAVGYTFGGWYTDAACTNAWDFDNNTVSANMGLWAKWTFSNPVYYYNGNFYKETSHTNTIDSEALSSAGISYDATKGVVMLDGTKQYGGLTINGAFDHGLHLNGATKVQVIGNYIINLTSTNNSTGLYVGGSDVVIEGVGDNAKLTINYIYNGTNNGQALSTGKTMTLKNITLEANASCPGTGEAYGALYTKKIVLDDNSSIILKSKTGALYTDSSDGKIFGEETLEGSTDGTGSTGVTTDLTFKYGFGSFYSYGIETSPGSGTFNSAHYLKATNLDEYTFTYNGSWSPSSNVPINASAGDTIKIINTSVNDVTVNFIDGTTKKVAAGETYTYEAKYGVKIIAKDLGNGGYINIYDAVLCDSISKNGNDWYNGDSSVAANKIDTSSVDKNIYGIAYNSATNELTLSKNLCSSVATQPTLNIETPLNITLNGDVALMNRVGTALKCVADTTINGNNKNMAISGVGAYAINAESAKLTLSSIKLLCSGAQSAPEVEIKDINLNENCEIRIFNLVPSAYGGYALLVKNDPAQTVKNNYEFLGSVSNAPTSDDDLVVATRDATTGKYQVPGDADALVNAGYILIKPKKPSPTPSPSKKDESCEKVIGPTWHWNNDKGICEDVGVVGTATR